MDLMRHLLSLSYMTGVKSGHMFVNVTDLEAVTNNDCVTKNNSHITHDTFNEDFQHVVRIITQRECRIAMHSLRNTAHLLAMFDNGEREDIRKSARH